MSISRLKLILGIETSCDETSAAVVLNGRQVLSNIVSSSANLFKEIGGVVPEMASRAQLEYIIPVIKKALAVSEVLSPDMDLGSKKLSPRIDAIAVTVGPGLLGSLLVGVNTAKALAWAWGKPLIAVNHLEGHLYANFIESQSSNSKQIASTRFQVPKFPCLHLLVSGGHTMLILQAGHGRLKVVGQTVDDAAGEAFDKVGRLLGLVYPQGPKLARLAEKGNPKAFVFPRAMLVEGNLNFSFSGLKTAVRIQARKEERQKKEDLAASFQEAVVDVLVEKSVQAVRKFRPRSFALSGGVSANVQLRKSVLEKVGRLLGKERVFIPDVEYTGDNAAMVAAAAYFHPKKAEPLKLEAAPDMMI